MDHVNGQRLYSSRCESALFNHENNLAGWPVTAPVLYRHKEVMHLAYGCSPLRGRGRP